ncbi:ATP-binding protein [Rhodovulum kholense]|uniref:histidine kinase n=2 Tax=Rhodovulum TaxID=34008 RepID=A0A8E3ARA4_9RHOB|nr:two-component system osmolarity sensor histidine kinase EnvZ [Rhodovulum kholense]RAP42468.1 two-component sensor histidine kinase [Rhodovulum viride]
MVDRWIKRVLPRGLYGRAALILIVPIVTIQLVVSVVFIQRHFADVTQQMTRALVLELAYLTRIVDAAPDLAQARTEAGAVARPLGLGLTLPAEAPQDESRRFYDLSGETVTETLRRGLPGFTGIDLATDTSRVWVGIETGKGPMEVSFNRGRVSASNPHQLLVLMVFTSALMTLIAFLFLRNQLRPIRRLARAADAFGKGRPIPYRPSGATEVRAAGRAFLDMRARIERQIEQRTLMLSGVSHDLRTPLTRLKLELSMAEDTPETRAMLRDINDMGRMIDTFLDFSRADALDDPEEVDPAALLDRVAQRAGAAEGTVELGALPRGQRASLRPMAVERALQNLIDNGLRHGTRVALSLYLRPGALVFTVEDDGPGIPEDQRELAMQPFQRLDESRNQNRGSGAGLGLAIAADIARGHGGALHLGTSARLGGLRADLVLAR